MAKTSTERVHKFLESHPDYFKTWAKNNQERRKKYYRERAEKGLVSRKLIKPDYYRGYFYRLRLEVLSHYCGGKAPSCSCCGENHYEFMAIDHVNGGGNKHRKEIEKQKGSRINMYRWLKANNFPEGYRILCHNCNQARGFYGACPHEMKK